MSPETLRSLSESHYSRIYTTVSAIILMWPIPVATLDSEIMTRTAGQKCVCRWYFLLFFFRVQCDFKRAAHEDATLPDELEI